MSQAKRILIIEDEQSIARALELKLTHSGFQTSSAADGVAGLERLEQEAFDLVLLDLIMPKMNGYEVLERLQAKQNPPPVIVLTNLGQEEDQERVRALGARGFFVKSNTPLVDIVECVQSFLEK